MTTPIPIKPRTVIPIRATPPPRRRYDWIKLLCQCIGLSSLILVMNFGDLLAGGADVRMHVPFSLGGPCFAQIADILLLGLLIFGIIYPLQQRRFFPAVRVVLCIAVPPYLISRTQGLFPLWVQNNLSLIYIAWAVLILAIFLRFNRVFREILRIGDALGIFFALFAFTSIAQLVYVIHWHPAPFEHRAAFSTTPQPPRTHPRIIWIVFDELSYDQVFEHRSLDLALPNFDALRAQSTLYTNMQPIGLKTVKIIPSLLSGQVVEDYRFHFDNSFTVHTTGSHGFHTLNGANSIFGDAQRAGWRTAAVGWYNPYCPIYGDAIDDCYWMNLDRLDGPMAQHAPFWQNTYEPLKQIVREIKAPARDDRDLCTYDVRRRLLTHLDLQKHAARVLDTDQADLVFFHFSIPHSPNVWSRATGSYTQFCDSSYQDNLALVDRTLGDLMTQLRASPRWQDTTVIVQGDHSWRIFLWNWLPSWTDEDDAASRRGFDPRPALLIHTPGQTTPLTNAEPLPLMHVHDVVEQTLHKP
jgi:hypothetical protein